MTRCVLFGLACLALAGCGPMLDLRDTLGGRVGPMTPYGEIKRDFWGNTYIEPYSHMLEQSDQRSMREKLQPAQYDDANAK